MKCPHAKTKVVYDQGGRLVGRKLTVVGRRCLTCGDLFKAEAERNQERGA